MRLPKALRTRKKAIYSWIPDKLYVVIFEEADRIYRPKDKQRHGKMFRCWLAADLRGYGLAQGCSPMEALLNLIDMCKYVKDMAEEDRKRGCKVVWENTARTSQDHIDEMRSIAEKNGIVLGDLNWRKCSVAEKVAKRIGRKGGGWSPNPPV
jgi:hypothetical protein